MRKHGGPSLAGAVLVGAILCPAPGPLSAAAASGALGLESRQTAYLGVAVDPVDPVVRRHFPAANGAGLTVRGVEPGSPAARAGLRRHDILLQWEDQWLFTPGQLRALLRTLKPGQPQVVKLLRKGAQEQQELVLDAREIRDATPEIRMASIPFAGWQDHPELAVRLAEIVKPGAPIEGLPGAAVVTDPERLLGFKSRAVDDAVVAQLNLGVQSGVVIVTLHPDQPAAQAGLEPGDIVVGLQGAAIDNAAQFTERLGALAAGSSLSFVVWRGGRTLDLQMTLPAPAPAGAAPDLPPVPAPGAAASGDWVYAVGGEVDWIILLENESSASPMRAASPAAPGPAAPADLFAQPPGIGTFPLADGRGSIEVQQRGGREHVIVRNTQGSVLYEGPMNTEADRLWLRPVDPALRQAAEAFAGSGPSPPALVGTRVWRWNLPPRYL